MVDEAAACAAKDALPKNTESPTIHLTSSNHALTLVERVYYIKYIKGGTLEQNLHTILLRSVKCFYIVNCNHVIRSQCNLQTALD